MAQERFVTPEKQLLKLIEDQKTPTNTVGVKAHAAKHHSLSFFSLSAWTGRLSFLRDSYKKWNTAGANKQIDIKVVNNLLTAAAAVGIFYLVINLILNIISMGRVPNIKFAPQDTVKQMVSVKDMSVLKSGVSYYLEKMRQRDIFKIGQVGAGPSAARQPEEAKENSKVVEAMQHLQLVGISWSSDPDAMIEDTKAMKTLFVKKGQMIGDLEVRAIFKDKVIIGYGEEEAELK